MKVQTATSDITLRVLSVGLRPLCIVSFHISETVKDLFFQLSIDIS